MGHLTRIEGQLEIFLQDECLSLSTLHAYDTIIPSSSGQQQDDLLQIYVQDGAENQPQLCDFVQVQDPFSQTDSFYSPIYIQIAFTCDFKEIINDKGIVWIIYRDEDLEPIGNRYIDLR